MAVVEEVFGPAHLDHQVMDIDTWTEFYFLHLRRGLLVLMFLGLFVKVLAVLHQFTDGWHRGGRDFDKVDAEFASELDGPGRLHDA